MASIDQLRDFVRGLPNLQLALVFGSVARGAATLGSDIDVALQFTSPMTFAQREQLTQQLAMLTGRPVDLIDLSTVGEPLLNEVVTTGIRLGGTDEQFAQLMLRNVVAQADFVPLQQRLLKERRDAWINK